MLELAVLLLAGQFALCACMGWALVRRSAKADLEALKAVQEDQRLTLKNHTEVLTGQGLELRRLAQAKTKAALGG